MNGFVDGRKGLLEFARNSAQVGRRRLEDDESPRPKKRRKIQAPSTQQSDGAARAAGAERRSTRSQSRRQAVHASQRSVTEPVVPDSDDAGSEYEQDEDTPQMPAATQAPSAREEPADGLVACPVCGKRMKEEVVFTHLDHCTSDEGNAGPEKQAPPDGSHGPLPPPRPSIAYTPPDSLSATKARDRLPTLAYSMLTESALRKKLQALGISSQGPKLFLQKRHTEWVNLWNANCDSRDPKPKRKLLEELDMWERTQGRQILQGMHTAGGGAQGTGIMAKDFDGGSWMRGNKGDFDELVRKAREKKGTAPRAVQTHKELESDSTATNAAIEVIENGGALTATARAGSDLAPETESEAQVGVSTAKSPFFDTAAEADKGTKVEHDDTRMPSPSEPSLKDDASQNHGSHINGVLA